MIVQCEHCQTKYRIADEKVKGKGVKVRCAKCENVFTVTPQAGDIQAPPAAPSQPTPQEPQGPPLPEKPSTPAPETAARESGSSTSPDFEESVKSSGEEQVGLPDETESEGSQELQGPDEEQDQYQAEPGQQLSGPHSPENSDISSDGEKLLDTGSQRPAHETDQIVSASPSSDISETGEKEESFVIEGTLREDSPSEPDPFSATNDTYPAPSKETGSEAEWGNIAMDDQVGEGTAKDDIGLSDSPAYPPSPVPVEQPVEQQPPDAPEDTITKTSDIGAHGTSAGTGGSRKKGLLILLLLVLIGAGGYYAYPTVMDLIQSRSQEAAGTLTPANIQVQALTRKDGRIIYAVRGEVKNESSGNVGIIQVEAQFRNVSGEVLSKATSYCGNTLEDRDLVTLELDQIHADLANELGQSLSNSSIPPGQSVPFLVVLADPPSGVSKVTVTILSFKETA